LIPPGDKQSSKDYVSAFDEELVDGRVIAPRKPGAKKAHFIRDEPKLWNKLGLLERDGATKIRLRIRLAEGHLGD